MLLISLLSFSSYCFRRKKKTREVVRRYGIWAFTTCRVMLFYFSHMCQLYSSFCFSNWIVQLVDRLRKGKGWGREWSGGSRRPIWIGSDLVVIVLLCFYVCFYDTTHRKKCVKEEIISKIFEGEGRRRRIRTHKKGTSSYAFEVGDVFFYFVWFLWFVVDGNMSAGCPCPGNNHKKSLCILRFLLSLRIFPFPPSVAISLVRSFFFFLCVFV